MIDIDSTTYISINYSPSPLTLLLLFSYIVVIKMKKYHPSSVRYLLVRSLGNNYCVLNNRPGAPSSVAPGFGSPKASSRGNILTPSYSDDRSPANVSLSLVNNPAANCARPGS